jgi:hypothetical protein
MSLAAADISDQESMCAEEAMSSTGEPTAKRARIEIKPYAELDLSEFCLKKKDGIKGMGPRFYPQLGVEIIRFNLSPSEWLRAPFGFDVNSKFEKPSFLGGKAPSYVGKPEGLKLRLDVPQGQATFLTELDTNAEAAFAKIAEAKFLWNHVVTTNPLFKSTLCNVNVILKGADLTKLAIVVDGKVVRGEGWEFIEPFIKCQNAFKFADVKVSVRARKVWNYLGGAGIALEATQLVLRPSMGPVEEDVFGDDAELLA